jgi:hypothetical protein
MAEVRVVTAKKKCCKDDPRCKRCPVVCKRLVKAGLAERVGNRKFEIDAPKAAIKAARKKQRPVVKA